VIRERLGIRMLGRGVFSNRVTIYFRAPVAPLMRGRNLSVIMVINPTLRGFFRIEKPYESGFLAGNRKPHRFIAAPSRSRFRRTNKNQQFRTATVKERQRIGPFFPFTLIVKML
jgi:hypothetical protein